MSNHDPADGQPNSAKPAFELSKWQKRQAALLYHFSSLDYLKGLKTLLDDFVKGVDITLDVAETEGRDRFLVSERWGVRDTVANFSTYGFPALQDFQRSVALQIAEWPAEYYHGTGYNQCERLLGELSMNWSTPEEEERFKAGMKKIADYALGLDDTMRHRLDDYSFFLTWHDSKHFFSELPKFAVRTEFEARVASCPYAQAFMCRRPIPMAACSSLGQATMMVDSPIAKRSMSWGFKRSVWSAEKRCGKTIPACCHWSTGRNTSKASRSSTGTKNLAF